MKKEVIDTKARVCQKKDIYLTELDDDRVMMDLDTGNYYILNGMGSIIWDKIHEEVSIEEIIDELLEEYDVEPEVCKTQVMDYLAKLLQSNLVRVEN